MTPIFGGTTERRRAEAEARNSENRYREVQMELAHANRVAAMGQLTASIAHEIRQPLSAVKMSGNTALRWLTRKYRFSRVRCAKSGKLAFDKGRMLSFQGRHPQLLASRTMAGRVCRDGALRIASMAKPTFCQSSARHCAGSASLRLRPDLGMRLLPIASKPSRSAAQQAATSAEFCGDNDFAIGSSHPTATCRNGSCQVVLRSPQTPCRQ